MGKFKRVFSGIIAVLMAFSIVFTCETPLEARADEYDTVIPEIRSVTVEPINADESGNLTTNSSMKVTVNATDNVGVEKIYLYFEIMSAEGGPKANKKDISVTYMKNNGSNEGWTIDEENNYSYTLSLGEQDYNGYVYATSVMVLDGNGNYANDDTCRQSMFRLLGSNPVPGNTSTPVENETFEIVSAGAYDANGNPYKTGDVISENTTVTYRVTTKENLPVDAISLFLRTNSTGTSETATVNLSREDEANTYSGNFTFTSDMYPTGWSASELLYTYNQDGATKTVVCKLGDDAEIRIPTVVLKTGSQIVHPTITTSIDTYSYDFTDGSMNFSRKNIINGQQVVRYTKLIDAVNLPEAPVIIDGVQTKWHVYTREYDNASKTWHIKDEGLADDYIVGTNERYSVQSLSLVAMPEGYYPVRANYIEDEDGTLQSETSVKWVKASGIDEVLSLAKSEYEETIKKAFSDAELYTYSNSGAPGLVEVSYRTSKVLVQYQGVYVKDDNGQARIAHLNLGTNEYTVSTLPTITDMLKYAKGIEAQKAPQNGAKGIKFERWKCCDEDEMNGFMSNTEGGLYNVTVAYAVYDKEVANLVFFKRAEYFYNFLKSEIVYYDKGTTDEQIIAEVKNRTVCGYTNWKYRLGGSETRYGIRDCDFYTDGDKGEEPETPVAPSEPSKPNVDDVDSDTASVAIKTDVATTKDGKVYVNSSATLNENNTIDQNGVVSITPEAEAEIVNLVNSTLEKTKEVSGDVVTPVVKVNMADATVISAKILKAAIGQDVDIVFVMTGSDGRTYSWTVNGNSITDKNVEDVNLKVDTTKSNVPASVISSSKADGMPNIQLNLADHGLFGFSTTLSIYVGKEYQGKYANLMYYTDNKLEMQNSSVVDSDGYASLVFTHASDYIIALGDNLLKIDETPAPNDTPSIEPSKPSVQVSGAASAPVTETKSPKTGDDTNGILYVLFLTLGMAAVGGAMYKRKRA